MNLMCKAREIRQKASLKFNPAQLSNFVKFDGEIPVVDKDKLIMSVEDDALFCAALNNLFHWDYTTRFEHTTVFFEAVENIIYAGVYDEFRHLQITKVPIATVKGSNISAPYTYAKDTFAAIKENLSKKY